MTRALVALLAVVLAGCAGEKPPAPASSATQSHPAAAPQPAPAPDAPAPAPAPVPQVLYVKTHLANFREGVGTSRKILRVLRQGARLQVLETRSTWLRVRLDDGQEGWIAESVTSSTAPVTPARAPAIDRGLPEIAGA